MPVSGIDHTPTFHLSEGFRALDGMTTESASKLLLGRDLWREPTGQPSLGMYDSKLASMLTRTAPSKGGIPHRRSFWSNWHFDLALPALRKSMQRYRDFPQTANIVLDHPQVEEYFSVFPFIARHAKEVANLGQPEPAQFIRGAVAAASADGLAATIKALPASLRAAAQSVLNGQDSLVGRTVLASLLARGDFTPQELGVDRRVQSYLAETGGGQPGFRGRPLHERLLHVVGEIPHIHDSAREYDPDKGISVGNILGHALWYAKPGQVEMIRPGLEGASFPTASAYIRFFEHLQTAHGAPDLTIHDEATLPTLKKFRDENSLAEAGRLATVVGALDPSAGAALHTAMRSMYSTQERVAAWHDPVAYTPDADDSAAFTRDLRNIVVVHALSNAHERPALARMLFQAAEKLCNATDVAKVKYAEEPLAALMQQPEIKQSRAAAASLQPYLDGVRGRKLAAA